MKLILAEHRKAQASPNSAGSPARPAGLPFIRSCTSSSTGRLDARAASAKPLRIGLIGAGKFGAMYLSQIPTTPGIHLLGIADLSPPRARENLARLGWKPDA